MASTTTNTHAPAASVLEHLSAYLSGLLDGLAAFGENSSRMRQITRLSNMSDSELADLGVRREDIARYVFRDTLFL